MDVDGLPIIGPGVDYTQVNQFTLKSYVIDVVPDSVTFRFVVARNIHLEG
jgi:hypothetical protein